MWPRLNAGILAGTLFTLAAPNCWADVEIYFSDSWCPPPDQRAELQESFDLLERGCCIRRATLKKGAVWPADLVESLRAHITPNPMVVSCGVEAPEIRAIKQRAADRLEQQARIERERTLAAQAAAPEELQKLPEPHFCAAYGEIFRSNTFLGLPASAELIETAQREAVKRRLGLTANALRGKALQIGDTGCIAYAILGMPDQVNRTVTRALEIRQLVYGQTYVYLTNGRVTAFQD